MVDGFQLLDEYRLGILDVTEGNGTFAEVAFIHLSVNQSFPCSSGRTGCTSRSIKLPILMPSTIIAMVIIAAILMLVGLLCEVLQLAADPRARKTVKTTGSLKKERLGGAADAK